MAETTVSVKSILLETENFLSFSSHIGYILARFMLYKNITVEKALSNNVRCTYACVLH